MITRIMSSGLSLSIVDGGLAIRGPQTELAEILPMIKRWKPELIKILEGETVDDVGVCDQCGADLLGLLVKFDSYVNRVCPQCGQWFQCLPPASKNLLILATATNPVCQSQPITLF
jgi:hypothetical protein|tara:strand:+ start:102 stop:449 length:348 start_codon:yes stop_codon:yes gene_type:complete